ncbi:hypothetical protein vseg_020173 [Gypsophila vaccaria]
MSKVRLVRCPKCDKLLPEPSGFPVYKCGGCGALLQAKKKKKKKKSVVGEGSSSTSSVDKERVVEEGDLDMAVKSPTRLMVGELSGRNSPWRERGETEFDGGLPKSPMRDRFLDDLVRTSDESRGVSRSPVRERGGGSGDFDRDGLKSPGRLRYVSKSPVRGRGGMPGSVRVVDVSRSPMREGTGLGGLDGDVRTPERSVNGDAPKSPLRGNVGGSSDGGNVEQGKGISLAPKASFNDWLPDDNYEGQSRDDRPGHISEGVESVCSDERGTTSEGSLGDSTHGIGCRGKGGMYKDGRYRSDERYDRPNSFDGPSYRNPDPIYGYGDPRQSFESDGGPASVQELQLQRVELLRKYEELKDQLNGLDDAEASSQGFYRETAGYPVDKPLRHKGRPKQQFPPRRNVQRPSHFSHVPGRTDRREDMYGYNYNHPLNDDLYAGQMIRMPPSNQQFLQHTMRGYVPGRSLDFERDGYESYVNDAHGHHPACGCSSCYSNDWRGRYQRSSAAHKRHESSRSNSVSSYSVGRERYSPRASDPRKAHTSPRVQSSFPAYDHRSKSKDTASLNKRLCRPISGGSPFVLCDNCFQLLKLPGNFIAKHKNQQLKCGSCSTVISFGLQHEPSVPVSSQKKPDAVDAGDSSDLITDPAPKHEKHRRDTTTSTYIGSYDFDVGDDTFQPVGPEASTVSKGHRYTLSLPENNTLGFVSSPSRFSVDKHIADTASVRSGQDNSMDIPTKIRPPPGSPLQDHLDFSSQFFICRGADKHIIEKHASPEAPLDGNDGTETDPVQTPVPEKDKLAQSPINALLKPLKDVALLPSRGSAGKVEVYVNGQAISQRAVRKAEKLAGKIHPGEYWYDPKAGFWGVMGHQCLGIIPPSIKEFSAPMPEDCSKGDTAVYVNGRELNQRDLGLLARRGIPTTKDRRYVVDISGRVLDEGTRDFIVNLGRLAPSVEANKRGFGMHVPQQLNE